MAKKKGVARTSKFHGEFVTKQGPTTLHGTTLDDLKKEIEKATDGVCVYRPDPRNEHITFVYNTQYATSVFGEDYAQVPMGWIAEANIPAFLAEGDASAIEGQVTGIGDEMPGDAEGIDELLAELAG